MRNGKSFCIDENLEKSLKEFQRKRVATGIDKKKKSLTKISRIVDKVLKLEKNKNRMITYRCPV